MAATDRAVHQVLEHGHIFSDPLAVAILGVDQDGIVRQARQTPSSRRMQLFISIRTQFAQAALAAAYERGVRQLLVLGAGLDTYAYRRALPDGLRVFEIEDPSAQAYERQLAQATVGLPRAPTYIALDFEQESCTAGLAKAGFDRNQRTLVTWLGVVPYLTEHSVWKTLEFIAGLPGGAEIVFDYSNPPHRFFPERRSTPERRVEQDRRASAHELEETCLSYLDTPELHERLRALGFTRFHDLGPVQIAQRYLPEVAAPVSGVGGHIVHIATA